MRRLSALAVTVCAAVAATATPAYAGGGSCYSGESFIAIAPPRFSDISPPGQLGPRNAGRVWLTSHNRVIHWDLKPPYYTNMVLATRDESAFNSWWTNGRSRHGTLTLAAGAPQLELAMVCLEATPAIHVVKVTRGIAWWDNRVEPALAGGIIATLIGALYFPRRPRPTE